MNNLEFLIHDLSRTWIYMNHEQLNTRLRLLATAAHNYDPIPGAEEALQELVKQVHHRRLSERQR